MPEYAVLCRIEASGVKSSEGGINLAKHGILTHRKAFKSNDKNPVCLPWQYYTFIQFGIIDILFAGYLIMISTNQITF